MRYIISLLLASAAFPAMAEVPRVLTDIPPVHALTAKVMEGVGTPDLLLERGASEHGFQMRPSQAAMVADADLVVWIGPELTPWLDRAVDALGPDARHIALLAAPGVTLQDYAEGHDDHAGHDNHATEAKAEGHDDHGHDDHGHADHGTEKHDDHGHDEAGHEGEHAHTGVDPHAWLDPANAQVWVQAIAAELSALDPENAATYAANATKTVAEIAAMDADLAARLAAVKDQPFFVFHDAYGYFAAHYGLTVAGSISLGDASAPGAAHLEEIRAKIAAGTPCLFPEPQYDPKLMLQLAEGTGARIGGALDPNGSSFEASPQVYSQMMTGLADTLLACIAP